MFLYEEEVGKKYKIIEIKTDTKIKHRLEVMGLTNNTQVEILNKNINGALILKVKDTRFAISKEISKRIEVMPYE